MAKGTATRADRFDKKQLARIETLVRQGLTLTTIAERFGCSSWTVRHAVKKLGGIDHIRNRDARIVEAHNKGVPLADIGKRHGLEPDKVFDIVARAGRVNYG